MKNAAWIWVGLLGVVLTAACDDSNSNGVPTGPFGEAPPPAVDGSDGASDTLTVLSMSSLGRQHFKQVVKATGDISGAVDEYRGLLGEPNNGAAPGAQPVGRREINWDGVPPAVTNTNEFPADFFNTNSPRGVVFSTPGTGFRVSDNNFADVNQTYARELNFFSPIKTFSPVGSNVTEVRFFEAGSATAAHTTGFGAVFSDVDRGRSAVIEYLDDQGRRLLVISAPPGADQGGLSFVGAVFNTPIVARVRIFTGRGPLGAEIDDISSGGVPDLVILDDFLYGEPKASS